VAVHGRGHRVVVNTAQSGDGGTSQVGSTEREESPQSPRGKFWAKVGGAIVGLASVAGMLWQIVGSGAT
jgi:hypothetical protein